MTNDDKDKEADEIEAELRRRADAGDVLAKLFLGKINRDG